MLNIANARAVVIVCCLLIPFFTFAADVRLFHAGSFSSSLAVLLPEFERNSGHKVVTISGTAGSISDRVEKGEPADVVLVTSMQIKTLFSQGKLSAATVKSIGRVGVGIATSIGGTKPDASSIDTFKRSLLAATSIGHLDPKTGSSSGTHAARWLAGIDIAAELRTKTKWFGGTRSLFRAVSSGEVQLGFGQVTEIRADASVELAGRFPEAIQNYTEFSAAATTYSDVQTAAHDLIEFLVGPRAAMVMQEKGFEVR